MSRGTALFLCDVTGKMAEPWLEAGYKVVLVDPQHARGIHDDGSVVRVGYIITDALDYIGQLVRAGLVFVAGFPPCTDVAVSGARWWEDKRKADPYFQAKAAMVAEQCRMTGALAGCPWMFENPVSAFAKMFGAPGHSFNPHDFTGFCEQDNYTKKTCIWSGGGFVMPPQNRNVELGKPDNRIHFCPPGKDRANIRSATPLGFARAVYLANAPHLKAPANDNQTEASQAAA